MKHNDYVREKAEKSFVSPAGYTIDNSAQTITFTFNPQDRSKQLQHYDSVKSVTLGGSFNQWNADLAEYTLLRSSDVWTLSLPLEAVRVPGSSGFPEFKFVIDHSIWVDPASSIPSGYAYSDSSANGRNLVIVQNEAQVEEVRVQLNKLQQGLQRIHNKQIDGKDFANWRGVDGKIRPNFFYRSSAPWKPNDDSRSVIVRELIKTEEIRSIIGLAGNHTKEMQRVSAMDARFSFLLNPQSVLFIDVSYNSVYYSPSSLEFSKNILDVIEFMKRSTPPFLIFCQEGKDRTGVFVAVLRALVGDSWNDILEDYQKSERAGFSSLPHKNLLEYSFESMIGPGRENLRERMITFLAKQTGRSRESVLESIALFEKSAVFGEHPLK